MLARQALMCLYSTPLNWSLTLCLTRLRKDRCATLKLCLIPRQKYAGSRRTECNRPVNASTDWLSYIHSRHSFLMHTFVYFAPDDRLHTPRQTCVKRLRDHGCYRIHIPCSFPRSHWMTESTSALAKHSGTSGSVPHDRLQTFAHARHGDVIQGRHFPLQIILGPLITSSRCCINI